MGCACQNYPTLRGRTFQVPQRSFAAQESKPVPGVSKSIPQACPIPTLPTCNQCNIVTAAALPECDADELAKNPCTLIVANNFELETCYTAGKAIKRALRDLDGDNRTEDLREYLSDFNQVIAELNASPVYKIQIPMEGIVSSCGNCEYYLPPYFKQMISLTNDVPINGPCYKVKRYINPPHEQFYGSTIPEHYTIMGNKILVKDPNECGCGGTNRGCACFLKVHYWGKLPRATSLDDCLAVPEYEQLLINLNLTVNIGTMNGLNADKVALSQQKLERIISSQKSYNNRNFDTPRYLNSVGSEQINSWLSQ